VIHVSVPRPNRPTTHNARARYRIVTNTRWPQRVTISGCGIHKVFRGEGVNREIANGELTPGDYTLHIEHSRDGGHTWKESLYADPEEKSKSLTVKAEDVGVPPLIRPDYDDVTTQFRWDW
jgi:hypothetical protein